MLGPATSTRGSRRHLTPPRGPHVPGPDSPRWLQANSQEQVAQAHFAVAECHEALGDTDAAVTALEQYMDLTRLSSPAAHGQACCKFGALYYRAGEYAQVRHPPSPAADRPRLRACCRGTLHSTPAHGRNSCKLPRQLRTGRGAKCRTAATAETTHQEQQTNNGSSARTGTAGGACGIWCRVVRSMECCVRAW